jgi:hypothetical protein
MLIHAVSSEEHAVGLAKKVILIMVFVLEYRRDVLARQVVLVNLEVTPRDNVSILTRIPNSVFLRCAAKGQESSMFSS